MDITKAGPPPVRKRSDSCCTHWPFALSCQLLFTFNTKPMLPSKSKDLANVWSTVIPGDQVESELCNEKREKIFAERKDTTL